VRRRPRGRRLRQRLPTKLPVVAPHLRRPLLVAVAAALLLVAAYFLWLRDAPLVQVDEVTITGLTSKDADRIRTALETAADDMTTLHVRHDRLDQAVAGFPVVRGLEVSTDFPDGMRIHVIEHHPVALVASGRSRVPVAADGSVLRGLPRESSLPRISVSWALPADRVRGTETLELLRVAGAAPAPLARRIDEIARERDRGIVVTLKDGPELVFGGVARAGDKWRAATRVLADKDSQGSSYVDVRLPERPAAGGLAVETIAPVETFVAPVETTDPALADPQP